MGCDSKIWLEELVDLVELADAWLFIQFKEMHHALHSTLELPHKTDISINSSLE